MFEKFKFFGSVQKKNPVQQDIKDNEAESGTSIPNNNTAASQYLNDPVFNRCINIFLYIKY